jgi:hypothetical protein
MLGVRSSRLPILLAFLVAWPWAAAAQPPKSAPTAPALQQVIDRMAAYVQSYGARTSLVVAVEKYMQQVTIDGRPLRPRNLLSEYAIVKVDDRVGWAGFRDVVKVDGTDVSDRRDRLERLFTGPASDGSELKRIADESARYNVGPISRNLNTPTTALHFLHPERISRFTFKDKGTKTIDGVKVLVLDFKETTRPTLVMKRDGTDVPCEGTVWVVPGDGTVVRTRLKLRNFANTVTMGETDTSGLTRGATGGYVMPQPVQQPQPAQPAPTAPPAPTTPTTPAPTTPTPTTGQGSGGIVTNTPAAEPQRRNTGNPDRIEFPELREIESLADIEVSYKRDAASGLWLPAQMTELYDGPLTLGTTAPVAGRAVGRATYSDFKRFETSGKVVLPK